MRQPANLKVEFYVDVFGKLRIKNIDEYEAIGFKIKSHRGKNYTFPIFKISTSKR